MRRIEGEGIDGGDKIGGEGTASEESEVITDLGESLNAGEEGGDAGLSEHVAEGEFGELEACLLSERLELLSEGEDRLEVGGDVLGGHDE